MTKLFAIFEDTLREAKSRKIFLGFFIFALLVLVVVALGAQFVHRSAGLQVNPTGAKLTGREMSNGVASFLSDILVFLSIFATASVFPHLLEKGTAEIYLSKPVSRGQWLYGKFFSVVGVIAVFVAFVLALVWLVFFLRFGSAWAGYFLFILSTALKFAILFAFVTCITVLSRSSALALILTFILWVITGFLAVREGLYRVLKTGPVQTVLDWAYYILPKPGEIDKIGEALVRGNPVPSYLPVWSSVLFAVALLLLTHRIFLKKDY